MSDSELKLALIGGGAIARGHAAALHLVPFYSPDVPRWRPRLVCEATAALADSAMTRLGFEEATVGYAEALQRSDIDAVIIATPPDLHSDIAVEALQAGKHVLCEKPLARTAPEAQAMLRAAESANRVALAGFNLRYAPALLQAKRLLRDGACGDVFHVSGRYLQDFGRDPERPLNWRYQAPRGGSGALADIGSHLLDCIRWLVGDISAVMGIKRTVIAERPSPDGGQRVRVDVDDHAAFMARFDSNAFGTFEVSRVATGRGNHLQFDIYGSNGSLSFDWERNNELLYFSADDARDRQGFRRIVAGPALPAFPAVLPVRGLGTGFLETMVVQLAEFARAITGTPSPDVPTFRDGFVATLLVDTILQSTDQAQWSTVRSIP
jgi:predicted dehydrogenase